MMIENKNPTLFTMADRMYAKSHLVMPLLVSPLLLYIVDFSDNPSNTTLSKLAQCHSHLTDNFMGAFNQRKSEL